MQTVVIEKRQNRVIMLHESLFKENEIFWQVESYGTFSKLDPNLCSRTEQ